MGTSTQIAKYTLTPIPECRRSSHNGFMVQLAIRCQPVVPVAADELEQWLEQEMRDLRADAPAGIIRLSRLTQGLTADCDIGWLVELELPVDEPLLKGRLDEALRDMRLLGLQPTLLAPNAVTS
jgi:hypothetical protein